MRRTLIALLFAGLVAEPLLAQEVVVAYVDGVLEVREGSRWSELYIGDALDQADRIRLSTDSYAELSNGRTTIKLSRAGTFEVSNLIEGTSRTESTGIAGLVLNRIGRLSGREEEDRQTTQAGVRADRAGEGSDPLTWAGGETVAELVDEGLAYLNGGAYEDAYLVFQEAYDYAVTDREYAEALFYYGYASTLVGRSSQAFDLLEEIGPEADTAYFPTHVLALGQLLVESFAYDEAVDYLMMLVDDADDQEAEDVQSAQLLLGIAYDGLGRATQARTYLRQAARTVPGNATADAAERLLENL